MSEKSENPYIAPSAKLNNSADKSNRHKFKRFTAWGVFALTIITLGVYPIYWLYSRATVVNTIHEKPISSGLLVSLVVVTILSLVSNSFGESDVALISAGVIAVAYMVIYFMVLFKVRNRLVDIINDSSDTVYKLGPVMTFFFFTIYLQYKINEYIDESPVNT